MPLNQRWLFRVSSHHRYGRGHIARCSVLAKAMRDNGSKIIFQLDPGSTGAAERLKNSGLESTEKNLLLEGPWSGCVIDNYELLGDDISDYTQLASPVVIMDDFLNPPTGAHLLINSAFHLTERKISGVQALLGPAYALVEPRFSNIPRRDFSGVVHKILITLGRTESPEILINILEVCDVLTDKMDIKVVIDRCDPSYACIIDKKSDWINNISIVSDVSDMLPLLKDSDFIIGSGGVSLIERVAAGVPSLTILGAENQRLSIEGAGISGVTIDGTRINSADLLPRISSILEDSKLRVSMSKAGRELIDGMGGNRIADFLCSMVKC
ncbi:MAG: hypothetical protein CMD67_00195 [Gammaproteobacteria bacterium]|nr:hypothetical protein [Gammaproteobacteria bacterium]